MAHEPDTILPRLRTNLGPDSVLDAPPPVPPEAAGMTLRVVDPSGGDPSLISGWMNRRHLAETWDQAWDADRWRRDAEARLAGTYSSPCIIGYRGRPIGYLEIYRPHRDEVGRLYPSEPHDLGIHIAVAEPEMMGLGLFPPFLHGLIDALFAADPACRTMVADPDHRNARVRGAIDKLGVPPGEIVEVRPGRIIDLRRLTPQQWTRIRVAGSGGD